MTLETLLGVRRGRPSAGLGGFDEDESTDLALHARNCARRYDDLRGAMDLHKTLLIVIILLVLAGNTVSLHDLAVHLLSAAP